MDKYFAKQPPENVKRATATIYKNDDKTHPFADCYSYSEDFILTAGNSHYELIEALRVISVYTEKALSLYSNSKEVDWKTLAGACNEKAKEAILKATKTIKEKWKS